MKRGNFKVTLKRKASPAALHVPPKTFQPPPKISRFEDPVPPASSSFPSPPRRQAAIAAVRTTSLYVEEEIEGRMTLTGKVNRINIRPIPNDYLYPYQRRAVEKFADKPGLVAFSMGLGKTRTSMALMLAHYVEDKDWPTSIFVGPTAAFDSLLNDQRKLSKIGVNFVICQLAESGLETLKMAHIVFCTYSMLARAWTCRTESNAPGTRLSLEVQNWLWEEEHGVVVLDEAHTICNASNVSFKACMDLQAQHRIALTGTPIMNTPKDLLSLRRWLRVPPEAEIGDNMVMESLESVSQEMNRTAIEVRRFEVTCGFQHPEERELQKTVLHRLAQRLHLDVVQEEPAVLGRHGDIFTDGKEIPSSRNHPINMSSAFTALLHARQACLVPALVAKEHASARWATTHSTKLNMLAYYLANYDGRVIIMTFFASAFPYITQRIREESLGDVLEYNGDMKQAERDAILGRWRATEGKEGAPRFLLATVGTAGVCLNLRAKRLVMLEPMYNPQRRKQAEARITRIDGIKSVVITSLMIRGSIEECITNLANEKEDMADSLLRGKGRLNTANIKNFILKPLQKSGQNNDPTIFDEEAMTLKSGDQDSSDSSGMQHSPFSASFSLDACKPFQPPQDPMEALIKERGKKLTEFVPLDFSSRFCVEIDSFSPGAVVDVSATFFEGDSTFQWSMEAYEKTFLEFETLESAQCALSFLIQDGTVSSDAMLLGRLIASRMKEESVCGIFFQQDKKVLVFDREEILEE